MVQLVGEQLLDMHFPLGGIDRTNGFERQLPRQLPSGEFVRTTPLAVNVRGYETLSDRSRGGSRPGLARYHASVVNPSYPHWIIQSLNILATTTFLPMTPSSNLAGRYVILVAVVRGEVYYTTGRDQPWRLAYNATGAIPPLAFNGVMQSAANNQKLYFADGMNFAYFDPADAQVKRWLPSAGAMPIDSFGNAPRLICTWRGRTVLSGLLYDPQNWFMSAVNDPTNFDYAPAEITPTQAVAGNNSPVGLVGDVITGMCPYNDDVLIFFTDHEIHILSGDPMAGGRIDRVSDVIGGVWGMCWAKDPFGNVYFFSNRSGIYTMVPGRQPVRISQGIEQLLEKIDTGRSVIRLAWNDRFQGLHVFVTPAIAPVGEPGAPSFTNHFFWDYRTSSWYVDRFGNKNHDPLTVCIYDGNQADDRVLLLGGWDGHVRYFEPTSSQDDGSLIHSEVVLGPLNSREMDELILKDIQAILGEQSGSVEYYIHVGPTAEKALSSPAVASGMWHAGRNYTNLVRKSGHAIYVRIKATSRWSMELLRLRVAPRGKVRRRGV